MGDSSENEWLDAEDEEIHSRRRKVAKHQRLTFPPPVSIPAVGLEYYNNQGVLLKSTLRIRKGGTNK